MVRVGRDREGHVVPKRHLMPFLPVSTIRCLGTLIFCTIGRRAALCPRSTLTYLSDTLRVSLRDALPCIPLSQ